MIKKTFVAFILFCLLYQPGIYQASAQDLCSTPVDVILLMDASGSMAEGAVSSRCSWEELKWVGGSGGSFQCVNYSEQDISELECMSKPTASQCRPTIFTSSSPSKMESAKSAANSFIDNLGANDQSAIGFFNSVVNIEKQLSNNHSLTKSAINGLAPNGATNIGGAIAEGAAELSSARANPRANKVMVLLTDGKANLPNGDGLNENPADIQYALDQAVIAASMGYKIFTIGLGSDGEINEPMLINIASASGASYYHAPNGNHLGDIYAQIAFEVCQYGSISGCKYIAQTPTSTIETSQTASGWQILLNGRTTSTQTTDEDGCYSFGGLLAGLYSVFEGENQDKQPFALIQPQPNNYSIDLAEEQNLTNINFLNYLPFCGNQIIDWDFNEVCEIDSVISCTTTDNYQGIKSCNVDCLNWADQCHAQEFCADNIKNGNEQCDDGNNQDNDGCSAQCFIEEPPVNQPPIINLLGDNPMNLQLGDIFSDLGATSTDPEDGDLTAGIVRTGSVDTSITGDYLLIYTITDSGGLSASTTRTVIVSYTPPAIVYQCSDNIDNDQDTKTDYPDDPGCESATDNDETDPVLPPIDQPPVNQPPAITLLGLNPLTVQLNATFTDPGATSTDPEDGDLTSSITATSTVNTSATGTYSIIYSVSDSGSLSASTTRTVIVSYTPPAPVYQCSDALDNDQDGQIDYPNDSGCEDDTDNDETDPIPQIIYQCSDNLDNDNDGTIDANDKTCHSDAVATNTESYLPGKNAENEPPEITLIGGANLEIFVGDTYNDRGATAFDPEDGDITDNIITTGAVDTATAGAYKIYYNVQDSQWYPAAEKFRVIVVKESAFTGGASGGDTMGAYIFLGAGAIAPPATTTPATTTEQTTSTPPEIIITAPSTCSFLEDYLQLGEDNQPGEVAKLQLFLTLEGFSVETSGVFDQATFEAVKQLQERYKDQILSPWGIEQSTGYVFITTKNFINEIYCKIEIALTGDELSEIERVKALLTNIAINQEPIQAPTTTPAASAIPVATTTGAIGETTDLPPEINPEQTIGLEKEPGLFTALISGFSKSASNINVTSGIVFALILLFTFAFFFLFFRLRRKSDILQ